MANYLGQTYKPATPRTDENFALMVQVAQMKQSVYDAKKAQINQTLEAFGNIDVLREQDKEYIAAKLNSIRTDINGYGNRDLSQSGVGEELMSKIKVAAQDPFIQGAVQDAYSMRNYQQTAAKTKEKNPELYSDVNYAYGLEKAGYEAYMRGDQKRLGNLSYTDYTDVNSELKDIAENLDKYAQVVKETTPDGIYYKTVEGKYLDKARIRNIAQTQLSDKAKGQMHINSWANWEKTLTPQQITQNFNGLRDVTLSDIDSSIASLETELKNTNNNAEKIKLNQELQSYKDYRSKKKQSFDNYTANGNVVGMAFELEQETLFNNFSSTYAPTFTLNTSYSTNTAYFEQQKIEAKALEDAQKANKTEEGLPTMEATYVPSETPPVEFYNATIKKAKDFETAYKVGVNSLYNRLSDTEKQAADKYIKDRGISQEGRESGLYDYFEQLSQKSSNIVSIQEIEEINKAKNISAEQYKIYNESTEQAYKEEEQANLKNLYDQSKKYSDLKTLDDNGQVVKLSEYLYRKGINSFEDFSQDAQLQDKLWKQYYADMALSTNKTKEVYVPTASGVRIPVSYKDNAKYVQRLTKLFGGDKKKAEDYIEQVRKNGLYDTNKVDDALSNIFFSAGNPDNSFQDDKDTRSIANSSKIEQRASQLIGQSYAGLSDRAIRVNPKSSDHTRIASLASDPNAFVSNSDGTSNPFKLDKDTAFSMLQVTPEIVEISQVTLIGGDPVTNKVQIYKNNIPQDIQAKINFGEPNEGYTPQNFPKVDVSVTYNTETDIKRRNDIANSVFDGNLMLALQTTKEESIGGFFNRYPQIMGTQRQPTETGQIFKNIIENNNLVLKSENIDGQIYPSIVHRVGDQEIEIFKPSLPIPSDNLTPEYKKMKYAPQLYVNKFLDIVATNIILGKYDTYYENLRALYGNTGQ